jgi:geranylgeranyl pyrophosphate synthase
MAHLLPEGDGLESKVFQAMRYAVMNGGKRLRPFLVVTSAQLFNVARESALRAAAAVEMVHTYSLVHDDLPAMDDDDVRRGKPSCHKAFGEAAAILAGDALQSLAFEVIARETPRAEAVGPLARELARAIGTQGMVGGQMMDLEAEGDPEAGFEAVETIHRWKTGALMSASLRCGALAGGADRGTLAALTRFGEDIGLAFQIADDILDVTGSTESLGKSAGKDAARGKATWPAAAGIEASRERARALLAAARGALEPLGEKALPLHDLARFIVERSY